MKYDLTAAVVGTGFMGEKHIAALKDVASKLIICSTDVVKGQRIAKENSALYYADFDEMQDKEKIDVLHVCVPTPFHCPMTVAALNKGINVLCEKPFASSVEEADMMLKAAKDNGKKLMIGQCVRFDKGFEYLRKCIADKRFGSLTYLNSFRHGPVPSWSVGNWLKDVSVTGGVVRDVHIHDIDFIKSALGRPKKAYSKVTPFLCSTTFDYEDGVVVTANCTWRNASEYVFYSGYDAVFEKATVTCKDGKPVLYTNDEICDPLEKESFPEFFTNDSVETEIRYFYGCVANNTETEMCLAEDCRDSLEISFKLEESMKSGETVRI